MLVPLHIRLLLLTLLLTGPLFAQKEGSLTDEFDGLSAKERSKIAKQEEGDAEDDEAFKAIMAQAEAYFREKNYEASLGEYKKARILRPYNVYPKVKIQDITALIAQQEQDPEPAVELGKHTDSISAISPVGKVIPDLPVAGPKPVPKDEPNVEPIAEPATALEPALEKTITKPKLRSKPAVVEQAEEELPEGQIVSYHKEGRALVCERTITIDGRTEIYRRVTHPWGEHMYFKDGIAVPERVWTELFGN